MGHCVQQIDEFVQNARMSRTQPCVPIVDTKLWISRGQHPANGRRVQFPERYNASATSKSIDSEIIIFFFIHK